MVLDESMLRRSNALREMMDLARFIVADGNVTEMEAKIFRRWLERNPDMLSVHPVDQLVGILRNAFADGEPAGQNRRRHLQRPRVQERTTRILPIGCSAFSQTSNVRARHRRFRRSNSSRSSR